MKVANQKDAVAGILLTGVGAAFAVGATSYHLGTASAMGPGYVPLGLGVILAGIGLLVLTRSLRSRAGVVRIERVRLSVLLAVLVPIILFGLLLDTIGLALAIILLVMVSSFASHELTLKDAAISAVLIAVLCVVIFVIALRVQVSIFPNIVYSR